MVGGRRVDTGDDLLYGISGHRAVATASVGHKLAHHRLPQLLLPPKGNTFGKDSRDEGQSPQVEENQKDRRTGEGYDDEIEPFQAGGRLVKPPGRGVHATQGCEEGWIGDDERLVGTLTPLDPYLLATVRPLALYYLAVGPPEDGAVPFGNMNLRGGKNNGYRLAVGGNTVEIVPPPGAVHYPLPSLFMSGLDPPYVKIEVVRKPLADGPCPLSLLLNRVKIDGATEGEVVKVEPEGTNDDPRYGETDGKDKQKEVHSRQREEVGARGGIPEADTGEGGVFPVVTLHPGPEPEPVDAEGGDGQEEGKEIGAHQVTPSAVVEQGPVTEVGVAGPEVAHLYMEDRIV